VYHDVTVVAIQWKKYELIMYSLNELKIETPNGIGCKYFAPYKEGIDCYGVLIVSFYGRYPDGSQGSPHAEYISRMTMQGLQAFDATCVILDFRELIYSFGNTLLLFAQDITAFKDSGKEEGQPNFPVVVVTSDKCRDGFLSLIGSADYGEPSWHFSDINDAIEYVIIKANEWLEY
jgi:hypothetical protein